MLIEEVLVFGFHILHYSLQMGVCQTGWIAHKLLRGIGVGIPSPPYLACRRAICELHHISLPGPLPHLRSLGRERHLDWPIPEFSLVTFPGKNVLTHAVVKYSLCIP